MCLPMNGACGIQRNDGDSVGTVTPRQTLREVNTARVECTVVTDAMLIKCP